LEGFKKTLSKLPVFIEAISRHREIHAAKEKPEEEKAVVNLLKIY
jgi:hypothetical protein